MLPKKDRLSVRQFDLVMKDGRVHHSSLFLLRTLKNTAKNRFAMVVSQKVAKQAVTRNKFKRIGYKLIRDLSVTASSQDGGRDTIVFLKSNALTDNMDHLLEDLKGLFVKAGIIQ